MRRAAGRRWMISDFVSCTRLTPSQIVTGLSVVDDRACRQIHANGLATAPKSMEVCCRASDKLVNAASRLPPYSPGRNPDELVWKHLKADTVGRTSFTSLDDFKTKAKSSMLALQRNPEKVQSFLQKPSVKYAA